jgi:hypothetical protein
MDLTLPAAAAPPRAEPAREPPRPPRGPVLMGDLTGTLGGRPLLLVHFDQAAKSGKVTPSAQPR